MSYKYVLEKLVPQMNHRSSKNLMANIQFAASNNRIVINIIGIVTSGKGIITIIQDIVITNETENG